MPSSGIWEHCSYLTGAHYLSTTELSQLILCKISGFHSGCCKEWRLLGYKNPVRTSQETRYISATEHSRLMLCKIWGFHGGDYEEYRLLGCYAVWFLYEPKIRRNLPPPWKGDKNRWTRNNVCLLILRANVVPSSTIFITLMTEALGFSETSVITRATRRNIPEDGILHIFFSCSWSLDMPLL
jgi:hypothetical protein